MKRRNQIAMTDPERETYLKQARSMALATIGPDGYPHVVAMSFMVDAGNIYMTSFTKAQKVLNIRRNPKVAVLVESGAVYAELKGVMIRGDCELIEDSTAVFEKLRQIREFHNRTVNPSDDTVLRKRANKRIILNITPRKISSWDHEKLPTGVY